MHDACRQAGDVKVACKRARGGWRNEAAGKGGGVRRGCNRGHPRIQASAPASAGLPPWARGLAPSSRAVGLGGVDAAAPPPGTTPPSFRRDSASPGAGETEEEA